MNRRDAAVALLALAAGPGSVFAQAAARTYRVAVVFTGSADSERSRLEWFQQALRRQGYNESNLKLELNYADGYTDRLVGLVEEAIARKPDVIVTSGSGALATFRKASSKIPIVMPQVGDPVALGLAVSLARPGGNFTGNATLGEAIMPKSLELLHETLPAVRTIGVLSDPAMPIVPTMWKAVESAAKRLPIALERFDASTPEEIDRVLGVLAKRRPGALLLFSMPLFNAHQRKLIESLNRDLIPQFWTSADDTDLGAFMTYSANARDLWRNAATFVHRILQGARPGDLPFEQATTFELVINLRTAKMLGIKIPQSVLIRADRVIE